MFLTKGTTTRHVYERAQVFLQNDPILQDITQNFTPNMFSVQVIEVLGTPIGIDTYIMEYVAQHCIKIIRDVEKHDHLATGFVHDQLMKICMNTRAQYMSANITSVTSPRAFLIGTTPARRHDHRECNPLE